MPLQQSSRKAERVVRKQLADGTLREYRYPAIRPRPRYGPDSIAALIAAWKRSPEWEALAASSRKSYTTYLRDMELLAANAARDIMRRDILEIRDAIAAARGHGAANGFLHVAFAIFAWALDREWIEHTPMTRVRLLPSTPYLTWTEDQVARALAHLPESLRRVVVLALGTAQRRGDLCRMTWADYDGERIRVRQQKTGEPLIIRCHPELCRELDAWRRDTPTLTILAVDGRPWEPQRLSERMRRALARIEGLPSHLGVHGLRKLAATRLADAGCTTHEIAAVTGHRTLQMVAHYTRGADQERLASAAIHRLQTAPTTVVKIASK